MFGFRLICVFVVVSFVFGRFLFQFGFGMFCCFCIV